jgi:hypothetical protein
VPDGADGEVQVDPTPEEVTQDQPQEQDGVQPDVEDAVTDETQGDPTEEDVVEELPPAPPVDCGGEECEAGEECCFTTGPAAENCVDIGTCTGGVEECDEAADCPDDQICCHQPPDNIGTACVDTCDDIVVCGDDNDCPDGTPYCCSAMGGIFSVCGANPCG